MLSLLSMLLLPLLLSLYALLKVKVILRSSLRGYTQGSVDLTELNLSHTVARNLDLKIIKAHISTCSIKVDNFTFT